MAGVRDPAFWKRFSTAVHMDLEAAQSPDFQQQQKTSWLVREQKKGSRRSCICWSFWISFFVFVTGVVIVIVWLLQSGLLTSGVRPEGDQASWED